MNPSFADKRYQRELAQRGAFLEYDMIGMSYYYADESAQSPSDEENARAIRELIDDGYIQQILLSQDVFLKNHAHPLRRPRLWLHTQAILFRVCGATASAANNLKP